MGYVRVGVALQPAAFIDMSVPQGAGGFYSTTNDLLKWLSALEGNSVLSPASKSTMFEPQQSDYGCGWFISPAALGHTAIHHNGEIDGFSNAIWIDKNTGTKVIVLSNIEGTPADQIANALMAIALL